MKPGSRAEVDWSETPLPETIMGHVADVPTTEPPSAVRKLYVPDPEARRGWREFYVPAAAPQQSGRSIGFGRARGGSR